METDRKMCLFAMDAMFEKFNSLKLDTTAIGLSKEDRDNFLCTPVGANIFGWDNGIHYCFIDGFGEIVFCVNPDTCCDYYVYPVARNFTDFLRLLLSLKTTNAMQQVILMDKEDFESFMNDSDEIEYCSSEIVSNILHTIHEKLQIDPLDHAFEYIMKLQSEFPYDKIRFTDEFYDATGLER